MITGSRARFQGVGVIDLLIDALEIVGYVVLGLLGLFVLVAVVTVVGVAIAAAVSRWWQRFPSAWKLSLLVRLDEASGRLHPAVQVRGRGRSERARLRLELVDGDGRVRLTRKRPFPQRAFNGELALPTFAPPAGVTPAEALGWRWDVAIEDEKGERVRWHEHPRPAWRLNAEAELVPGPSDPVGASSDADESTDADGRVRFELGCFTHMSYERGPAPTYELVERPNYRRGPASVARPAHGAQRGSVSCEGCGARVAVSARSRGGVRARRAARLLLGAALTAYVAAVYSGPTGEIGAGRALLLTIAFPSIFVALWAFLTAFFSSEVDLGLEIAEDPANHRLF